MSSFELSALFVLSVADVHGVQLDEIERRRTLVMGVLLGQSGSTAIGNVAERTGCYSLCYVVGADEPVGRPVRIRGKWVLVEFSVERVRFEWAVSSCPGRWFAEMWEVGYFVVGFTRLGNVQLFNGGTR